LTLARVKAPLGPVRQALASIEETDAGSCHVSQVTLFQSRLSPRGASYSALAHGRLRTGEMQDGV
jgi:2'-5' RNA ligase